MALLFMDGFEASDYNLGKYQAFNANATIAVNASTRYGTGLCLGGTGTGQLVRKDFTAATKLIVGVAFKAAVFSDTVNLFTTYGDAGTINHVNLRVMASGAVALYRLTTQLAVSAAGVCLPNTWHYIELSATVSDTVGVATGRVDGVSQVTFTGDTRNAGTNSTLDRVDVFVPVGTAPGAFIDDLYIADGTGSAPTNDFLGEVRVQTLRPNGAGAVTQLTPVGSATNWQNVDETPPSATDYNWSGTVGQQDLYTVEDLAVGTSTIYGCQFVNYAQKTDAATRQVINLIRAGGTTFNSAPRALTTAPTPTLTVSAVNPSTAAAWTVTDVNSVEAGVEVA